MTDHPSAVWNTEQTANYGRAETGNQEYFPRAQALQMQKEVVLAKLNYPKSRKGVSEKGEP